MTQHVNNVTSTVDIVMGPLPAGFAASELYGFVEVNAVAYISQHLTYPFQMPDGSDGLMAARADLLQLLADSVAESRPYANAVINTTITNTVVGPHVHIVASGQAARIFKDTR